MLRTLCGALLFGASVVVTAGAVDAEPGLPQAAITAAAPPAGTTAVWGSWRNAQAGVRKTDALIHEALRYLGRPYHWAGVGRGGFDCSGLVSRVFAAFGIALPHSSSGQYGGGTAVPAARLVPGDLVFFRTYTSGPSHVGIYLGANRFIHASVMRGVIVSSMDEPYYRARYMGARRY
jgi:cell wall-associated NlpC family hydrolase